MDRLFGHLKHHVPGVAHDLRSDLDQLFPAVWSVTNSDRSRIVPVCVFVTPVYHALAGILS